MAWTEYPRVAGDSWQDVAASNEMWTAIDLEREVAYPFLAVATAAVVAGDFVHDSATYGSGGQIRQWQEYCLGAGFVWAVSGVSYDGAGRPHLAAPGGQPWSWDAAPDLLPVNLFAAAGVNALGFERRYYKQEDAALAPGQLTDGTAIVDGDKWIRIDGDGAGNVYEQVAGSPVKLGVPNADNRADEKVVYATASRGDILTLKLYNEPYECLRRCIWLAVDEGWSYPATSHNSGDGDGTTHVWATEKLGAQTNYDSGLNLGASGEPAMYSQGLDAGGALNAHLYATEAWPECEPGVYDAGALTRGIELYVHARLPDAISGVVAWDDNGEDLVEDDWSLTDTFGPDDLVTTRLGGKIGDITAYPAWCAAPAFDGDNPGLGFETDGVRMLLKYDVVGGFTKAG